MDNHCSHGSSLSDEIRSSTGLNPADCYQCGKCSAGCPMVSEMRLPPHQIIRLVQMNKRDRVLADESIWLCLTCETCTNRCPNEFDPARMIDGLREMAMKEHLSGPRRIDAFHRSFLDQIRSNGRVHEIGLIAAYKLRSGALFDDLTAAPGMLSKGKMSILPHRIQDTAEMRRIFEACKENPKEK
jgi:heterodisulfide reductase subunit C2